MTDAFRRTGCAERERRLVRHVSVGLSFPWAFLAGACMRVDVLAGVFVCAITAASITLSPAQQTFNPPAPVMPPSLPPAHVVDLMTAEGSAAFGATWKIMEAKLVEVPAVKDAKPQYKTTHQFSPAAGEAGFDDSGWPTIAATDLGARHGGGHVSFMWYRAALTIPPKIGNFDTAGAQAVLRVLVDDYAEIWLNGDIPRRSGYPSPATIQGLNMPNRVVLGTSVKPGDKFQIAVFGINGPISVPRGMIWFREAKIEFYK